MVALYLILSLAGLKLPTFQGLNLIAFPGLPITYLIQQVARLAGWFSYRDDRARAGIEVTLSERLEGTCWVAFNASLSAALVLFLGGQQQLSKVTGGSAFLLFFPALVILYLLRLRKPRSRE